MKKKTIVTLIIVSFCLFSALISTQSIDINKDINIYNEEVVIGDLTSEEIKISEPELLDTALMNMNFESLASQIFGYSLIADDPNPIDSDEFGQLTLIQEENQKNLVDQKDLLNLELNLESGDYFFYDVLVTGELYTDLKNNQIYIYDIDNPRLGFFMNIFIYPKLTEISLAFDGGDRQLCYEGLINEGFSTYNAYLTSEITAYSVESNDACLTPISEISFIEQKQEKLSEQLNNVKIVSNLENNDQSNPKSAAIATAKYGIVHNIAFYGQEGFEYITEDDDDDIAKEMLTTQITVVVERNEPSESDIESDLQYYNKDYVDPIMNTGFRRNVFAYHLSAHGRNGSTSWMLENIFHWLTANEVEDLWYSDIDGDYYIDVYPSDMIILAATCHGMDEDEEENDMAHAFVDDGATAFCGTNDIYLTCYYIDLAYMSATLKTGFWGSLCGGNNDVEQASRDLIRNHNNVKDPEYLYWYYNTHFFVLGTPSATLT